MLPTARALLFQINGFLGMRDTVAPHWYVLVWSVCEIWFVKDKSKKYLYMHQIG
jgi:hypothetical protein